MDLSRMLSSEKRDDLSPTMSPIVPGATPPKRARLDPPHHMDLQHRPQPVGSAPLARPSPNLPPSMFPRGAPFISQQFPPSSQPQMSARALDTPQTTQDKMNPSHRAPADSPYAELQTALYAALENNAAMLTTGDKLTLALEVLRARQLEADLVQARSNIKNIVTRSGPSPITLRAVIPSAARAGMQVGTPLDISGKLLLSPANNDPQSLLLTLELHNVRAAQQQPQGVPQPQTEGPRYPSSTGAGSSSAVVGSSGADNGANGQETTPASAAQFSGSTGGLGTGINSGMGGSAMGPGNNNEQGLNQREGMASGEHKPPPQSASSPGAGSASGNPGHGV